MNTCVMCGGIVLNGDHVCKYCSDAINKRYDEKVKSDLALVHSMVGNSKEV